MVDLSTRKIKQLFEQQMREITRRTVPREETFDYQLSGGWIR